MESQGVWKPEKKLLTVHEVVEFLGVHVRTLIASGRLPSYRVGRREVRIDPADLDTFLQQ